MRNAIRANVREMIRLIGLNLYPSPSVVIRELIQNAYDSILGRYGQAASKEGRISVRVGQSPATLQITDNGTGMDRQDLIDYLSTIGQGIKKAELGVKQDATIGEYGIGFYSSFMIADEIIVTTRKLGTETTLRWRSLGLEEYDIEEVTDANPDYGTEVKLVLQRRRPEYSNATHLQSVIIRHCDYVDCSIYLAGPNPVNTRLFPWEAATSQATRQQIERHLHRQPVFWTTSKTQAQDVQLFLSYSGSTEVSQAIYCKRMFVTDALRFLPQHLRFIDVVVNSDSLSLTMSRQAPIQNESYKAMVDFAEESIMTFLRKLLNAERANPKFLKMLRDNQIPFRQMALENRSAFDKLFDLILFRMAGTPNSITISDYIAQNRRFKGRVLFLRESAEGESAASERRTPNVDRLTLATAQEAGIPVIGIRSEEDEELLRKICIKVGVNKAPLERYRDELLSSSASEPVSMARVRSNFERFLTTRTHFRDFQPAAIPILLDDNAIALNVNSPFLPILGGLNTQYERIRPLYVHLHRIMRSVDRSGLSKEDLVEIVGAVTSGLEAWCEEIAEHSHIENQLKRLSDRWWSGPSSLDVLSTEGRTFQRDGQIFRYRCFIACPFSDTYRDVINIIRSVLMRYGVYAETAAEIDSRSLMEKICLKIDQSQFAIVDVSESNPNVLFELGVLLARRKPAIIIRSAGISEWAGIRVPSDLAGVERIEYRNTSEDLKSKLEELCQRIFGGSNAEESERTPAGSK